MNAHRYLAIYGIALLLVAFALHLGWEFVQCQPFFVHGSVPPTVPGMLAATAGDLGLTGLAYAGTALAAGSWGWPAGRWGARVWLSLMGWAIGLGLFIEWRALNTGRWAYNDAAILLPGTSVSALPILQLVLLFPLSFALARLTSARWLVKTGAFD